MESQAKRAFAAVLEDGERHDFDTEEEFDQFIAGTRHRDMVRAAREAAKAAARPNDSDVRAIKAKTEKIDRELKDLAQRLGLEPNSPELFAKATVERDPGEPEIFDATLIFGDPGFLGATAPVYGDVWDLNYIGLRGRVGSLFSDRSLVLYSQPGFRGLQYWVFVGQNSFATVADLEWFNGLAASLQYQA